MSNDTEQELREVGPITQQQVGAMLKATTDYLQSQGLYVNIMIAIVEAGGFYTVGNMPDAMMEQVCRLYLEREGLAGADAVKVVDPATGKLDEIH